MKIKIALVGAGYWGKNYLKHMNQSLLEKHYIPMVKTFITKVVGNRGIVVHEFSSEEFK